MLRNVNELEEKDEFEAVMESYDYLFQELILANTALDALNFGRCLKRT